MTNKQLSIGLFPLMVVVFIVTIISFSYVHASSLSTAHNQSKEDTYIALLNGSESVPPVNTNASGITQISVTNGENLTFSLKIDNITNAIVGHIHKGAENENGPHIYTLFVIDDSAKQKGTLERNGTIIREKFEGPLAGKPIQNLVEILNNGSGYVNIHNEQYPKEFLRGKILPE